MHPRTCYLALILLSLFFSLWILFTKSILAKADAHIPAFNPFSSLLPYLETPAKPVVVPSKLPKIKKQKARAVKKIEPEQIKVSKESLKKSPRKKAVLSRADQLSGMLKLEDIIETSEGRYAFIDENMVKYFVQQGEWLDKVYVKRIDKNLVELKEIDGKTIIILKLKH